jgi:hypothetical protein
MENEWYYLEPDNNKPNPECGLYCARCKRKLKETQLFESFTSIEVHSEHPWFRKNPKGKHLIGSECLKKVMEFGAVNDQPNEGNNYFDPDPIERRPNY